MKEKMEAEKVAKRATDDLRILATKHDRLLAAQRATNAIHYQRQPPPTVQPQQQQPQQSQQQQSFGRSPAPTTIPNGGHKRSFNDHKASEFDHEDETEFKPDSQVRCTATPQSLHPFDRFNFWVPGPDRRTRAMRLTSSLSAN